MLNPKKGTDHRAKLSRMNKIEGQVRGIKKMIEEEKYCVEILTQFKAVRSALKSMEMAILEDHMNHCLMDALNSGSKKESKDKINEITDLLRKVVKA